MFDKFLPSNSKFPIGTKERVAKTQMLGERAIKFLNYLVRTPILFFILNGADCNFLDTRMGGSYEKPVYFKDYPCQPIPAYLDDFYVFKISFHLYELSHTLLLDRNRLDFPEYVLHHLMTWALIHVSYAMNIIPVGAAVMLVHDLSDIPMCIVKLVVDITSK